MEILFRLKSKDCALAILCALIARYLDIHSSYERIRNHNNDLQIIHFNVSLTKHQLDVGMYESKYGLKRALKRVVVLQRSQPQKRKPAESPFGK